MSVRFKNAAGISLGSDRSAGRGAAAATIAFRIRFNWPPPSTENTVCLSSGVFTWATSNINTSSNLLNVYSTFALPSGYVVCSGQVAANAVSHVVVTYDKDDVTKQAMYINGERFLSGTPKNVAFTTWDPTFLQIGTFADTTSNLIDFDMEGVLSINGYAVTQAEVTALKNGADPTTFGLGAELRGYWPLTGTPGAAVTAADVGIANAIVSGGTPSNAGTGSTAGSSLVYGAAMPYLSPVGHGDFAVYSSGKTVRVGFELTNVGSPVVATAGSMTTAPTISINGGPPITLERPLYTGDKSYAGVMLFTPSGVTVPVGADVTISTVDGWMGTSVGPVVGVSNLAIPNRSGKPVYSDMPADLRVGYGFAYDSSYWSIGYGSKNLAQRLDVTYGKFARRGDDTVAENVQRLFMATNYGNQFDATGTPNRLGLYAIQYDDNDPANPTDISIVSNDGPAHQQGVTEMHAYANPGVGGVGKAKVYDVQAPHWTVSLASSCSASDSTLTLASLADVVNPANYDGPRQYLKVDDEYMVITAVDVGASQVAVTRGSYGSTAASHAANATGAMSAVSPFYDLAARFTGPGGAPNYKNLVILGPGDWTPPVPPVPINLDRSFANLQQAPKTIQDSLANGAGVLRYMSSTDGGFGFSCEPEHLRLDSDLYLAEDPKFVLASRIVSSETATAANCPYVYSHSFLKNAQKYTVTLAAAITTAPAAGTVEVIKITYDAANPVMYSIRLELPSGEVVRVLEVNGDDVTVVRGADGTTPATQAAGPIQARWRIPASSDAVYQSNGDAKTVCTTAENHNLWTRCMVGMPGSNDLNPLARINVTLTADVTSLDQTVFNVSVAAADAPYLVPGLFIVFRNECVRVETVSLTPGTPYTGTITVERKAAWSLAGRLNYQQSPAKTSDMPPAGTIGTGSSGGVYCVSADGLSHCWSIGASYMVVVMVTGPRTFTIRRYGMPDVNQHWNQVGVQPTAPILDDESADVRTAGPVASYSFTHAAEMTKLCPGCDHWLNIPEYASDDMVDAIAKMTLDVLPAGKHRTIVELGNEFWNYGSPRLQGANEVAAVCGYDYSQPGIDLLIYRGWAAFKRVQAVFVAAGRGAEVKFVLAWQQGNVGLMLARAQALGVDSDVHVVSTAPYFFPFSSTELNAAYNASSDEECLDVWKFDLEYNMSNIGGTLYADGKARRDYEAATGRSIEFIEYEGNADSYVPVPIVSVVNGLYRNTDLNYNPNNYNAAYDFPYILKRRGGVDGIALFDYVNNPYWNDPEQAWSMWGVYNWEGQQAGRGDGSDGKFDNRLCLVTPGKANTKHPTVNQDANVVSVRAQAVLDYNAAYAAYVNPGGGDTGGNPGGPGGNPGGPGGNPGGPGNGTGIGVPQKPRRWVPPARPRR